jgi:hypothetical protein
MRCDEQLWYMRQTTAFDPLRSPSLAIIERQLTPAPVIRALLLLELNQVRIGVLSPSSALQSAWRRRTMLETRCLTAQNELQTTAIDQTREKRQH